jgi:hypothetical protein
MNSLQKTIQGLVEDAAREMAQGLAEGVLSAVRSGSVDELLNGHGSGSGARASSRGSATHASKKTFSTSSGGRLGRRSLEDIDAMAGRIVQTVRLAGKEGMRAEVIREKLGIERKELPRPLVQALEAGWLKTTGQKRATTYFVGSAKKTSLKTSPKTSSKKISSKTSSKTSSKRAAKKGKRMTTKKVAKRGKR